jgi:hypothetical protein
LILPQPEIKPVVARQIAEEAVVPGMSMPATEPDTARPTAAERRSQDTHARRQAR